jgi:hypothetical protein
MSGGTAGLARRVALDSIRGRAGFLISGRDRESSESGSARRVVPWQEWQGSAFARVRSCSLACMETTANGRFERTGANGSERPLAFAMQKVVGSNPIIRSKKSCKGAWRVVCAVNDLL